MAKMTWDQDGERYFEAGIKDVALYLAATKNDVKLENSDYLVGVNFNGVTKVGESPEGADETELWADDIKYGSFRAAEKFGGSIEAYQYPPEFGQCNGERKIGKMTITQQSRRAFGLVYKSTIGDDVEGFDRGYKLHLVYKATCSPSSRDHETINDSPDAETLSWDFETTPTAVGTIAGVEYKPTSHIILDSRDFENEQNGGALKTIEEAVYGTNSTDPYLPTPQAVYALLTASAGTYNVTLNAAGGTITSGHNVTSYTTGTSVDLPSSTYVTKEGYTFAGWVEANGSGVIVDEIPDDAIGDKVFNAIWTES